MRFFITLVALATTAIALPAVKRADTVSMAPEKRQKVDWSDVNYDIGGKHRARQYEKVDWDDVNYDVGGGHWDRQ